MRTTSLLKVAAFFLPALLAFDSARPVHQAGRGSGANYFSCVVDGQPLTDNTDPGLYNPMTKVLTAVGENAAYSVVVSIPPGLRAGQTCTGCAGMVFKIKQRGNLTERIEYSIPESVTVQLTARSHGYAAGTFAFVAKRKNVYDEYLKIAVTGGKFGMSIINDPN